MASKDLHKMPSDDLKEYGDKVEDLTTIPTVELGGISDEHIAYGPGGVRGLFTSPYVVAAAFLASLGGFSFGYDQGVIAVINVMPQFHATYPRVDPSSSGAAFWKGFMLLHRMLLLPEGADTISRKRALSVVAAIFIIGAIMQTAAPDLGVLIAGRTITGVGVGTMALGCPLYISEISPPEIRGALLVLESISIVTGVLLSYWISYATRLIPGEASFRLPFGLQIVSAAIIGIGIHFFPFSPRWLAMVDREEEALNALAKLRGLPNNDERVRAEHYSIMATVTFQKKMIQKHHAGKTGLRLEVATWLDLFKKKTWRRTIVGCGVAFFQQFSGINMLIYYAPSLFVALGQEKMSLILAGCLNVAQFVATVVTFFIIDRVGRRKLAVYCGFGMTIPYVVIAVLYALYSSDWLSHPAAGWAAVSMTFVYMLVYGVSYCPLGWALPAEVFSTAQRSKGVALSTATVWICNFVIGVAVPPMLEQAGYGTYVFFACMCFACGVWAFVFVPETKGKTLEELDKVFGDGAGQEEEEVMRQAAMDARRRSMDRSAI